MRRGRPSRCPHCGSTKSISKGFRYRANGKAKDRRCKGCKKRYFVSVK